MMQTRLPQELRDIIHLYLTPQEVLVRFRGEESEKEEPPLTPKLHMQDNSYLLQPLSNMDLGTHPPHWPERRFDDHSKSRKDDAPRSKIELEAATFGDHYWKEAWIGPQTRLELAKHVFESCTFKICPDKNALHWLLSGKRWNNKLQPTELIRNIQFDIEPSKDYFRAFESDFPILLPGQAKIEFRLHLGLRFFHKEEQFGPIAFHCLFDGHFTEWSKAIESLENKGYQFKIIMIQKPVLGHPLHTKELKRASGGSYLEEIKQYVRDRFDNRI